MNKVYYIVQILKSNQQEVKSIVEQRFEDYQLEDALHCVSELGKIFDTDNCVIELVKWVNDVEDKVMFAI